MLTLFHLNSLHTSSPPSAYIVSFEFFAHLFQIYFLFAITAAGVVNTVVPCGGPKKSPGPVHHP